jgi:DNA-binding LacI/PurR family transcriptional regulator
MSVTIKDIAREAHVSHSTVSRALHDHPSIPPETVATIKVLADKMGYIPSAAARKLKTNRSRAMGVIVNNFGDPFWSDVIQGIDEILRSANYSIFIGTTHGDKLREKEVVQTMVLHGVDGVIVCSPQFSPEQNQALMAYDVPMVIVNNEGASATQSIVSNDDIYGTRLATRHLIELGHRRIAYIGISGGGRTNAEREKGFRDEMQQQSIPVDERLIACGAGEVPPEGYKAASQLLFVKDRPTAIICYNDYMTIGVYSALFNAGVRIPHDISVVGFDDIEISAYLTPALTTVRQYKSRLGSIVATTMLQQLATREKPAASRQPERILIRGELVVRASTAAAPESV